MCQYCDKQAITFNQGSVKEEYFKEQSNDEKIAEEICVCNQVNVSGKIAKLKYPINELDR